MAKIKQTVKATLGVYDYDFGGDVDAALAFLRVGVATCDDRDNAYIKIDIERVEEEQDD